MTPALVPPPTPLKIERADRRPLVGTTVRRGEKTEMLRRAVRLPDCEAAERCADKGSTSRAQQPMSVRAPPPNQACKDQPWRGRRPGECQSVGGRPVLALQTAPRARSRLVQVYRAREDAQLLCSCLGINDRPLVGFIATFQVPTPRFTLPFRSDPLCDPPLVRRLDLLPVAKDVDAARGMGLPLVLAGALLAAHPCYGQDFYYWSSSSTTSTLYLSTSSSAPTVQVTASPTPSPTDDR